MMEVMCPVCIDNGRGVKLDEQRIAFHLGRLLRGFGWVPLRALYGHSQSQKPSRDIKTRHAQFAWHCSSLRIRRLSFPSYTTWYQVMNLYSMCFVSQLERTTRLRKRRKGDITLQTCHKIMLTEREETVKEEAEREKNVRSHGIFF